MSRVLACHICGMSSISPLCPASPLDVQQPTVSYTPTPLSLIHPPPASLPDTSLRCVLSGCVYLPLHSAVFTASIHLCLFSPAALSYIKSGRDITHTETHTHTHKHTPRLADTRIWSAKGNNGQERKNNREQVGICLTGSTVSQGTVMFVAQRDLLKRV